VIELVGDPYHEITLVIKFKINSNLQYSITRTIVGTIKRDLPKSQHQSDVGTETPIQVMVKLRPRSKVEFRKSNFQVNTRDNVSTKNILEDLENNWDTFEYYYSF
jgi:hypothetical protein